MTVYVNDADFTLHHGDVREVLRSLPDGSVDCCVTSPPYWGLRDYGADGQIGLEQTPDEYVAEMVAVFREVRRVLADHGTLWLNLGDSYASGPPGNVDGVGLTSSLHGANDANGVYRETLKAGHATKRNTVVGGLKPKDLVGIPWRVAFALQADGWWLRSDIVWAKPNPMPESVTDRPTKAHEYVFLLTKSARYFFDQEAVREPHTSTRWGGETITQPPTTKYAEATANGFAGAAEALSRPGREWNAYPKGGRNVRSVWEIATQPYAEAHFATFPLDLPRRCIAAGTPQHICGTCGKPLIVTTERDYGDDRASDWAQRAANGAQTGGVGKNFHEVREVREVREDCGHDDYRPGVVLDPFMGSGTTALVARQLGRRSIGIELNADYCALAARRLAQQSLLAEDAA